jgi:hypothetical protein
MHCFLLNNWLKYKEKKHTAYLVVRSGSSARLFFNVIRQVSGFIWKYSCAFGFPMIEQVGFA